MTAVSCSQFKNHMEFYMDEAVDDYEPIFISRRGKANVALIPEDKYNNLLENIYLIESKANFDWLMESKEQLASSNQLCRYHYGDS